MNPRPGSRTVACGRAEARRRLAQAEVFLEAADLYGDDDGGPERSVAVSNAVLAGIAAVDAICCARLGRRGSGRSHESAIDLVREVTDVGSEAARYLRTLLASKQVAQYEARDPTRREMRAALRAGAGLVRLATAVLRTA